jgi:hypothetical protein
LTNRASSSFRVFIGGLTASQRERWRFPPASHPYYTTQTLARLEKQYPGWDSSKYLACIPGQSAAPLGTSA